CTTYDYDGYAMDYW
nr:immunoglobulin heavy chain junction region [Mus musculus]